MKLRSLLLIIGLLFLIFSSVTTYAAEKDDDTWVMNIGGSYFKILYQSEVNLINQEIKTILEMYNVMEQLENNGVTNEVEQSLNSISKSTFLTLEKVFSYMRANIPLDGDLSSLLDSKYIRYSKPFDRANVCDVVINIHQLKSDAGILNDSKSKFLAKNGVVCKEFDTQVNDLTFAYMKEWVKKMPTSKRLSDRKEEMIVLLNNVYLYLATVYSEGLPTATESQIYMLETERKELLDEILDARFIRLDKAEKNLNRYR